METAVFVLGSLLVLAVGFIAVLVSGSLNWYRQMVKEQEAHLRTRRQLYAAREESYWWRECATEYMEEVKRLNGKSGREAC